MPNCIVNNCKYYSGKKVECRDVTLHVFPKNLDVIKRWLQQMEEAGQSFGDLDDFARRVYDGKRSDLFRICSQHFADDCYTIQAVQKRIMKKDSIPTIFSPRQEGDRGQPARKPQRDPLPSEGSRGQWSKQQGMKWAGFTKFSPAHEDQSRVSGTLADSAGRNKDRIGVAEEILEITMEIVYLLTGEDYIVAKKREEYVTHRRSSHLSDGPPGTRSPSPVPPPHSLTHERNNKQKILELTNKMMSLLTGEVPVRCDDVTVYFSMEEWEYLEGHKELYRDVMMETYQPRGSPDASEVRDRAPNSPLDCKTSHFIKEESASCEETDICDPAESPQTELTSTRNEDGSPSDEDGNVSAPDTHTEHDGGDNTSVHVNEESASNEDYWIPTEHKGSTSTDKTQTSNTHFQCETPPDEGTYSCPECQERFTSDSDLLLHQTIHNRSAVSSLGCEKSSHSQHVRDQRIHTDEKPYSCRKCGKSFNRNAPLVRHLRIHTPFFCSKRGKSFSNNSHLAHHLRTHSQEMSYSCSECGKCFTRYLHLVRHLDIHTQEKPYFCSQCGERFKSDSCLLQHRRIHPQKKPHRCSECGKSFTKNRDLVQHLRTHTGEKPYSCSKCGKRFNRSSNLYRHLKLHSAKKQYECAECGKGFHKKTNLVSHQNSHTR